MHYRKKTTKVKSGFFEIIKKINSSYKDRSRNKDQKYKLQMTGMKNLTSLQILQTLKR